jgi:hypothetical protein
VRNGTTPKRAMADKRKCMFGRVKVVVKAGGQGESLVPME